MGHYLSDQVAVVGVPVRLVRRYRCQGRNWLHGFLDRTKRLPGI